MADFRMALQALGKGRVDDSLLRNQIRKLLTAQPQLAPTMLLELQRSHDKQEIGREVFLSLKKYISSCQSGEVRTQLPQGGEAPTRTLGVPTSAPGPASRAAPPGEDEVSTEISAAIGIAEGRETSGAAGTAPVASDWQPAAAEPEVPGGVLGVGDVIKHRFKLLDEIGVGGMGKVFKGIDLLKQEAKDKNPYVAIKLLNEDFKQHPEAFIALQRESSRQQKLAHPNIATVYDFDRIGSSGTQVYITMELLEGEPLNNLIRRDVRAKQGLPFAEAFPIIEGLGQALKYAHERNIVHSDFKPGNSFLCKDGAVKVLDFGIARAAKNPQIGEGDGGGEKTLFDPGKLGALTPAYASLEMLQGDDPDTRDDIYALGCVAYELLTGRHPFNKLPANTARDNKLVVAPVKGLRKRQMKALLRSLAFERKDRSASVEEFLEQLEGAMQWHKNPWAIAAVATVVLSVGATPVVLNYYHEKEIDALIAEVNTGESQRIHAVLSGFAELGDDDRRRISEESRDSLQSYFERRVALAANVGVQRYDFPMAGRILDEAAEIYADSLWLKELGDKLSDEKNQALYSANRRYLGILEQLNAGGTSPEELRASIKGVLDRIAQIDPAHPLLEDQRPSIAYLQLAQREFEEGRLQEALANVQSGRALDMDNASLANLEVKVERRIRVGELEADLAARPASDGTLAGYRPIITEVLALARLAPSSPALATLSTEAAKVAETSLQAVLTGGTREDAEQLAAEFGGLLNALKLGRELSLIRLAHLEGSEREAAIQELVGGSQRELERLLAAPQPGDEVWESGLQASLQQLSSLLPPGETLVQEIHIRMAEVYVPFIDAAAEEERFEEARGVLGRITDIVGNVSSLMAVGERVAALEEEFRQAEQRKALEAEISGRKEDLLAQLRGLDLESAKVSAEFLRGVLDPEDTFLVALQKEYERAYTDKAMQVAKDRQYEEALRLLAEGRVILPESAALERLQLQYMGDARIASLNRLIQRLLETSGGVELSTLLEAKQGALDWLQQRFPTRYAQLRDDAVSRLGQEIGRLRESDLAQASALALGAVTLFPNVEILQTLQQSLEEQPWEGMQDTNTALQENRLSAVQDMLALAPGNNQDARNLRTVLEERIQQAGETYDGYLQARQAAGEDAAALRRSRDQLQQALTLWSDNPEYLKAMETLNVAISRSQKSRIIRMEKDIDALIQQEERAAAAAPQQGAAAPAPVGAPPSAAGAPEADAPPSGAAGAESVAIVEPAAPWTPFPSDRPCEERLAGFGKRAKALCYDWIGDGVRGPIMVVIPQGDAAPQGFAISKHEISVNDFNKYCYLSKSCGISKEDKDHPLVGIGIRQAEEYARWLSERTGKTYRLPTASEWAYAANAGGKQPKKDFNCSVMLGEKKLKGTGLVSVKSGKSNGWGLNNYIGNAQEWVKSGTRLHVRGGAFQDPLSNCEISLEREHDGSPDRLTGFRLLREETG